ncbi:hypothetical protein T4B_4174 [Trichinella pseudospiralis]|uniref:Uncharacterized protein n=1 Tax=Trichinella pseudospiralis TaxID=6337 RepID=A0A0V1GB99_TRIPS|nr:hypothetical protein T4C_14165 [Trichinella pseudospiralis]KRY95537.1 hypothetical protein T4B_4174 [Trichinella pseudospiralis]
MNIVWAVVVCSQVIVPVLAAIDKGYRCQSSNQHLLELLSMLM